MKAIPPLSEVFVLLSCIVAAISGILIIPMGSEHAPAILWAIFLASMTTWAIFGMYVKDPNWFLSVVLVIGAMGMSAYLNRSGWVFTISAATVLAVIARYLHRRPQGHPSTT